MRPQRSLRASLLPVVTATGLGAGFALSFAPWGNGWLSLALLAGYVALVASRIPPAGSHRDSRERPRGVLGLAFGFGLGWFCTGVGWLYVSMHDFGELPAPLAIAAVVLLASYLSIYWLAATWLSARALASRGPLAFAAVFGATVVLAEWLRGTIFTGLPWVAVGYAQTDTPLAGYAPLLGVYGLGGVAAGLAALVGLILRDLLGRRLAAWQALALVIGAALIGAGQFLASAEWSRPWGEPIDVRLLQGNVPQQMKFEPGQAVQAMEDYTRAIEEQAASRPDLILLPETAWIVPWQRTPAPLAERILAAIRHSGATVGLGLPLFVDGSGPAGSERVTPPQLTNSLLALSPDPGAPGGVRLARYDKRHLVPFGEFIPPGFRWFVDMMSIPLGDFQRGAAGQTPFPIGQQRVAGLVCYEDAFGSEVAEAVRGGATVLANVTNVAWFGESHAADQHLQMARMRALELARPVVRATNTGITAAIAHDGRVLAQAPAFERTVVAARVQGQTGLTPYARAGDWPALVLAAGLLALVGLLPRRRRRDNPFG